MQLPGTPSDEVAEILATGRGEITTLFVSMAARHPDGTDAEYLRWHTLDHRPEQHRLAAVRASLRLVSTPACRSARALSGGPLAAVDHVMTYFFTDQAGLDRIQRVVHGAGRRRSQTPVAAPGGARCVRGAKQSLAPGVKVGSDVLPWLPVRGAFVVVERGSAAVGPLAEVEGVAGAWSGLSRKVDANLASAQKDQSITYCFLDDDPIAIAERLQPVLAARWAEPGIEALFAAPFFAVVPYDWDRYVP